MQFSPVKICNIQKFTSFLIISRTALDLAHRIHGKKPSEAGPPPIFVLHGLLGSKKNWESMSKKLASSTNRSIVTVDARNHGESPHDSSHTYPELAADISQLMDKLSVKEAAVIGHSMGGRTAMVLGLTEPIKVNRLVVVDVSPVSFAGLDNDFFTKLFDIMKNIRFEGVTSSAQARALAREKIQASGIVQHMGTMQFVLMNVGVRHDKTIGWMCNVDALSRAYTTIGTFPSEMDGKQYNGPTIFIGGEMSNYIPPSDIDGIKRFFPKVDLKYVPRVGHNVHAEDPNAFHTMVYEFLSE